MKKLFLRSLSLLLTAYSLTPAASAAEGGVIPLVRHGTDTELSTGTDTHGRAWSAEQLATLGGGTGDVVGPASATNNAFVIWDATTGKLVKNSAVTLTGGAAAGFTSIDITRAGIGVTSTDGLTLLNTTAAVDGVQQWSPRIRLHGSAWKTAGTAASQSVDWIIENQTVQGSGVPISYLSFGLSNDGGAYTTPMYVSSLGELFALGSLSSGSTSRIGWASRTKMTSPSSGVLTLQNAALTDFSRVNFGGETSSFPALKRSTTGLQARLADDSAYTFLEVATEAYGAGWDADQGAATKTDLYAKFVAVDAATSDNTSDIATLNSTAFARANHTGTQASSTITYAQGTWSDTPTITVAADVNGIWFHASAGTNKTFTLPAGFAVGTAFVVDVASTSAGTFTAAAGSGATVNGTLTVGAGGLASVLVTATDTWQVFQGTIATGSVNGILSAADWTTFNAKVGTATTDTLTNKTLDAAATGNVIKFKNYIYLTHPHRADGTNATIGTTVTAINYGHATFSNSVDQASNYVEYYFQVPEDIDTSVALRARIKVLLGGADTASHRYVLSSVSVADSAVPTASTLANAINVDFAGDASGASGDVETSAWTTLTSWAGALTAGQTWRIRFARDGDTSDASTVNSTELGLTIEYGVSQ